MAGPSPGQPGARQEQAAAEQPTTPQQEAAPEQPGSTQKLGPPAVETNSIGMKLVPIPAGEFVMGSPEREDGRASDEQQHRVRITQPFYLGAHEVTHGQYQQVIVTNPRHFKDAQNPVVQVSWDDAVKFCHELSALPEEQAAGRTYRLPTEAEWEYACRAESWTKWNFGKTASDIDEYAWYKRNSQSHAHPVGQLRPNAWGLFDMHGNVSEWCGDWYDEGYYQNSPSADPTGPTAGLKRVSRGGGWDSPAPNCRSACRFYAPNTPWDHLGFRVAAVPSTSPASPALGAEPTASPSPEQPGATQKLEPPVGETNSIGMKLVPIPAGEFVMGSPATEEGRASDEQQHRVRITQPFYLGAQEVTQFQYQQVMGTNPSRFKYGQYPVETVSWDDAVRFCHVLSALPEEQAAGRTYRLPTEAEWEYACRAGDTLKLYFGNTNTGMDEYAWYGDNSNSHTHPVGEKKANALGMYDMYGNVSEWCGDWYDPSYYQNSPPVDPTGPADPTGSTMGYCRVFRGGSWGYPASYCRPACRSWTQQNRPNSQLGFRVAAVLSASKQVQQTGSDG